MLFHSTEFVLGFLPACLAGYFLLGRYGGDRFALLWLIAASLFFYGWWNPAYLPLLCGSVLMNFTIASRIRRQCAATGMAGCGRGVEPRSARLVQIRRFPAAHRGPGRAGAAHHPAAGDQLLHLPADHVPGGHSPRAGSAGDDAVGAVCRVRHLLPAPDRRPDRPAVGDHPAIPRPRRRRAKLGQSDRRAGDLPAGPGQETGAGRHVRQLRRYRLRRRSRRAPS